MRFFAKFRRVTEYVAAVFLAAFSCFSLFACTVTRVESPVPGWQVDCGASTFIPDDSGGGEGGGGGGYCTNCVKMSAAECARIQADIIAKATEGKGTVLAVKQNLISTHQLMGQLNTTVDSIMSEGVGFTSLEGSTLSDVGSPSVDPGSQTNYFPSRNDYNASSLISRYRQPLDNGIKLGANDGIYNYFNESVKPTLEHAKNIIADAITKLNDSISSVDVLDQNFSNIYDAALSMNCTACSSESGSGGGGGGGGSSSSCPCADQIKAVETAVEECLSLLDDINTNVSLIKDRLNSWDSLLKSIRSYIKTIVDAVAPIGTNFVRAVSLRDLDGTAINMAVLDNLLHDASTGAFKQNEYAKLSWFSRVEYLLGSIAGVFTVTNRDSDVTSSVVSGVYNDISSEKDSLQGKVDNVQGRFNTVHTSFRTFFTSFNSAFAGAGSSNSFNLFPSWFGGQGLPVNIDSNVTQAARSVTSLFWTIVFTVILYNFILYGVKYFAFVLKIWLSQITQFVK